LNTEKPPGEAERVFTGLGRTIIRRVFAIALLAMIPVAFVKSVWNFGFSPTLAELHDVFSGPPSAADTAQRLMAVDDCLVKSVAKQPLGRLRTLLLDDLFADCKYSIAAAWLALHPKDRHRAMQDLVTGTAMNKVADRYSNIIERARPR
jgi:hypothetical protein